MGPSIHFLNLSAPHSGQDRFLGLELISLFGENHLVLCDEKWLRGPGRHWFSDSL